jgi:hypothetical protein
MGSRLGGGESEVAELFLNKARYEIFTSWPTDKERRKTLSVRQLTPFV